MANNSKLESRVLVISNNAFSESDASGRTLAQYIKKFRKENIAQLCVHGIPDFKTCENFYFVSDKDALFSVLKLKEQGKVVNNNLNNEIEHPKITKYVPIKKTPLKNLIRYIVWKCGKWQGKRFNKWLEDFKPEIVLLYLGDAAFLADVALDISTRRDIPLAVFTGEDYCFKDYNYINQKNKISFSILQGIYKSSVKKLMKRTSMGIFNTDMLRLKYVEEFGINARCIMPDSEIEFQENSTVRSDISDVKISYTGNLGLDRHKSLIDIADTLGKINKNLKLNIYGRIPNDDVKNAFQNHPNIVCHGFVSYNEVAKTIRNSSLLVHAEDFSEYHIKDLKYAFSTKIADCISSGTPFLIYAPKELAETSFLSDKGCSEVVTEKSKLETALKSVLFDSEIRTTYVKRSYIVSQEYFSHDKNKNIFWQCLNDTVTKYTNGNLLNSNA